MGAVGQSTMNTAIAIAFAYGISVDSTVAIAEHTRVPIQFKACGISTKLDQ